jgi:hypothetical protein
VAKDRQSASSNLVGEAVLSTFADIDNRRLLGRDQALSSQLQAMTATPTEGILALPELTA